MNYYSNNYLMHHGIKGMKWGVRRFQNGDGSLTPAGRRRYDVTSDRKGFIPMPERHGIAPTPRGTPTGAMGGPNFRKGLPNGAMSAGNRKSYTKEQRAEFKSYRKQMLKTGLRGSIKDINSGGKSTKMYNDIVTKKGRKYAEAVEKSANNVLTARLVGSVALFGAGLAMQYYGLTHMS